MKILAIDQSLTSSGFVIIDTITDELIRGGIIKTQSDICLYVRMRIIAKFIAKISKKYNVDKIAIEQLPFGNVKGNSSRNLAGLQAVIITELFSTYDINTLEGFVYIMPITSIKKFATGNGRASKTDMVNALPEKIKDSFERKYKKSNGLYDITDAYFIAKLLQEELKEKTIDDVDNEILSAINKTIRRKDGR